MLLILLKVRKKELRLSSQSFEMKEFDRIYEEAGGGWWGFLKGAAYNPSTLSSMLVSSISSQLSSIRNSEEVAAAALAGGTAGAAIGLAGLWGWCNSRCYSWSYVSINGYDGSWFDF